MTQFQPNALSDWIAAPWTNGVPDKPITGISKDTRTIRPGDLYIALRGEHFDGHDFVEEACRQGASGVVVNEAFPWTKCPALHVPDTLKGLQDMANGYRAQWDATVIGITGSVGKTTVKEMCADVLSVRGKTHRTAGNYNNHIGLPLCMMEMPADARHGVFEIGMNRAGEIGPLTALLQPQVGIITEVGNAHREQFNSVEEIAFEKAQLAARIPDSGMVVLDRDSPWYERIRSHVTARVVTVSMERDADYVGLATSSSQLSVTARGSSEASFTYPMPLPGRHTMKNALQAIALGLEMGMMPAEVSMGLKKFAPPPMRWEESEEDGIRFINDAYNANPLSMRASLGAFATLDGTGEKWAVIGGMRELGETAAEEHETLGRFIDGLGLDGVITVGELGMAIECGKTKRFFHVAAADEAATLLEEHLHTGDRVLLKASRGEQLEQVLKFFKEK